MIALLNGQYTDTVEQLFDWYHVAHSNKQFDPFVKYKITRKKNVPNYDVFDKG